jgi:hypothetical protein
MIWRSRVVSESSEGAVVLAFFSNRRNVPLVCPSTPWPDARPNNRAQPGFPIDFEAVEQLEEFHTVFVGEQLRGVGKTVQENQRIGLASRTDPPHSLWMERACDGSETSSSNLGRN